MERILQHRIVSLEALDQLVLSAQLGFALLQLRAHVEGRRAPQKLRNGLQSFV